MNERPLFVGLTGGIASGKTTATDAFAALGVPVVDTDLIAREVVAPGTEGLAEVIAGFGSGVLQPDGSLDRSALRSLVFDDADARRRLEAILHPRIRERAMSRAAAANAPYVIIVVPLLVETGFDALVDRVIVVDAPEAVQLERLMARDGVNEASARAALAAQADRRRRLQAADEVLDNSAGPDALREAVAAVHRRMLAASGAHGRD